MNRRPTPPNPVLVLLAFLLALIYGAIFAAFTVGYGLRHVASKLFKRS